MKRRRGTGVVRALVACVALLVPAGAWAVVAVDAPPASADRRVALAGLDAGTVDDEPTTTAPRPTTTTTSAPATTSTSSTSTTRPATTTTARPTVDRPRPTVPLIPPATSWQNQAQGVTFRMRMEPAAPLPGQPVRFFIDVASAEPCCTVIFNFGDGSPGFTWNNEPRFCLTEPSPLIPGPRSTVATHTYAGAGTYRAFVGVIAGDLCHQPPMPPPGAPPAPQGLFTVGTPACIVVGPPAGAAAGCPAP